MTTLEIRINIHDVTFAINVIHNDKICNAKMHWLKIERQDSEFCFSNFLK